MHVDEMMGGLRMNDAKIYKESIKVKKKTQLNNNYHRQNNI